MRATVWSFAVLTGLIVSLMSSLTVSPALATTFVMVSDESLVDQAPAIVEARVVSWDYAPTAGMPATDYMIEVDRVLKGNIPGSTLIVRVPGGIRSDGMGLEIFGAPTFNHGERLLLFLHPRNDGTFRIVQLMLGAFRDVPFAGRRLAVRSFGEAREVVPPASGLGDDERRLLRGPRNLETFTAWISDRVRGEHRDADYFLQAADFEGDLESQLERFTLFESPRTGLNMRWFFVDPVTWAINSSGQPGLTPTQVRTAMQRGISAWNNIPGVDIRYRLGGTTTASGGLTTPDGVNALQFEDPNNSDIFDGPFSCGSGGVLAIGGPWFTQSTRPFRGQSYHEIAEADIITNKGLECYFTGSANPQALADELFGHELGHTLGLGHSCGDGASGPCNTNAKNDALMRATIHGGNRGATLADDDRAAARALYGTGTTGNVPAAPSNLRAILQAADSVRLSWVDNSDDETGFQIQQSRNGEPFSVAADFLSPDTITMPVEGLQPESSYRFRVRARSAAGFSDFSNTVEVATAPNAPTNLTASFVSATQIFLTWDDNASGELDYSIEMSSPLRSFEPQAVAPAGTEKFTVVGLLRNTPYTFRVRARNSSGFSAYSNEASASTSVVEPDEPPCTPEEETLCLLNGRFRVRVRLQGGDTIGRAVTIPGSDKAGMFWFFDPANIELLVKMIDGNSVNNFYWTFYGALSNVEYWISVLDTATGETVTYHNPRREICGLGDVRSFPRVDDPMPTPEPGGLRAGSQSRVVSWPEELPGAGAPLTPATAGGIGTGTCVPGPSTLCLADNRFQVEVDWSNPRAPFNDGSGIVVNVPTVPGDETGFFWFFSPQNIELVVKVLDARPLNGHFWFFYGGLSDVAYQITVTDTVTGTSKIYLNDAFNICGDADVQAFPG
jgi:hypothetical protein